MFLPQIRLLLGQLGARDDVPEGVKETARAFVAELETWVNTR